MGVCACTWFRVHVHPASGPRHRSCCLSETADENAAETVATAAADEAPAAPDPREVWEKAVDEHPDHFACPRIGGGGDPAGYKEEDVDKFFVPKDPSCDPGLPGETLELIRRDGAFGGSPRASDRLCAHGERACVV